jgi:hypothetical protein
MIHPLPIISPMHDASSAHSKEKKKERNEDETQTNLHKNKRCHTEN